MNEKPKHEKVIFPLGRINVLKAAIRSMKKKNRKLNVLVSKMPTVQKLPTHCYCYFPAEYAQELMEKYKEIHYEKYGYVD